MVTSSRFECQQISSILGRNQGGKWFTRGAQFEQKRYGWDAKKQLKSGRDPWILSVQYDAGSAYFEDR